MIAKILWDLINFTKKVSKNINILLNGAYADKICSKCTFMHWQRNTHHVKSKVPFLSNVFQGFRYLQKIGCNSANLDQKDTN